MPEPPGPPEQVYREAAEARVVALGGRGMRPETMAALPAFRAVVEVAYRAGYVAAAKRVIAAADQPDAEAAEAYWSALNIVEGKDG